jgi:hypothetical protein
VSNGHASTVVEIKTVNHLDHSLNKDGTTQDAEGADVLSRLVLDNDEENYNEMPPRLGAYEDEEEDAAMPVLSPSNLGEFTDDAENKRYAQPVASTQKDKPEDSTQSELFDDTFAGIAREQRARKATKADDAEVPEYLWQEHLVNDADPKANFDTSTWTDAHHKALPKLITGLRKLGLK